MSYSSQLQIFYRDLHGLLEETVKPLKDYNPTIAWIGPKGEILDIFGKNALHFLGLPLIGQAVSKYFKLKSGDIVVTNDTTVGSPRLCDLNFVAPIYVGHDLRGHVIIQITLEKLLHHKSLLQSKVGGDEGYKIPPTPLDHAGAIVLALCDYLKPSFVTKDEITSSFKKVSSAIYQFNIAYGMFEKTWGKTNSPKLYNELQKYSEDYMRHALSRLPDGEYSSQNYIAKQNLNCKLKIRDHSITVDFTGSAKQSNHSYHCYYGTTLSSCLWFFLSLVGEYIPLNSGLMNSISIEAPQGSLVNPTGDVAGLGGYYETSAAISESLFKIYKKILKKESIDKDYKKPLFFALQFNNATLIESIGRGTNAVEGKDGVSSVKISPHNQLSMSCEVMEENYPIKMVSRKLLDDRVSKLSNKGGRGIVLSLQLKEACQFKFLSFDETFFKAKVIRSGDKVSLDQYRTHSLLENDILVIKTQDGEDAGSTES